MLGLCLASSLSALASSMRVTDGNGDALPDVVIFGISEQADVSADTGEASQIHIMDQIERQFSPQLLVIRPGDSVTFPNSDSIRHHVYSFSEVRPFEFQLFARGEAPKIDFPEVGFVTVGCNIHDDMIGHIIVSDVGQTYRSIENGRVEGITLQPQLAWYFWHPWMSAAGYGPLLVAEHLEDDVLTVPVTRPPEREASRLEQRFRRRLQHDH
ncbi:hypothetical protein [Aliidiomarina sanyensis]|uniref:Methylamine utilization protein n=1 Tax=Aliidiomarina sanyensis TaxID=1249555 RepID=A0A432WEW9_9GAMM|nr:hypothetical protein [Aliidiomarina sanyensis]RUO31370.1 hypothetical protein CWE11_08475 [Aliidiomarina sanyensis]